MKKNKNSIKNRKCTKNEIGHHITFQERSQIGSKTTRTATASSITSLWTELLNRNIAFRDGETRLWFFYLLELNIVFQELVSSRGDRGRCCGSRRFGTSSRSFLKSDMVSNFVFDAFFFQILIFFVYFFIFLLNFDFFLLIFDFFFINF